MTNNSKSVSSLMRSAMVEDECTAGILSTKHLVEKIAIVEMTPRQYRTRYDFNPGLGRFIYLKQPALDKAIEILHQS